VSRLHRYFGQRTRKDISVWLQSERGKDNCFPIDVLVSDRAFERCLAPPSHAKKRTAGISHYSKASEMPLKREPEAVGALPLCRMEREGDG
jgi:hypothetical protein